MSVVIAINEGEWGVACVFNLAFDISANTALAMKFIKPDETILLVTNPNVTAPNVDISTVLGIFSANHYAQYIFQAGDLDQTGIWYCRVIYDDATPRHLISNMSSFTVTR